MKYILLILTLIPTLIHSAEHHNPTQEFFAAYYEGRHPQEPAMRDLVKTLGFDVHATDDYYCTPLHRAAQYGHEHVCRLLLEHKANVNAAASDGSTPLLWAANNGHEAVCRLLLEHGAIVNAANKLGDTPISWAADHGREALCRLIIEHRANVNAANKFGNTPIHWAAANGHEAVCRLLIEHGAIVNAANSNRCTPLLCAARHGHEAVCRLLIYAGGRLEFISEQMDREKIVAACSYIPQLVLREDQAALDNIMAPVPLPGRFRKLFMWAQRLLGYKTPEQKRQGQLNALLWSAAGQAKKDLCQKLLAAGATPWDRCPQELLPENYPQTILELDILLLQHEHELLARYQQSPDLEEYLPQAQRAIENYMAIRDIMLAKINPQDFWRKKGVCKDIADQQNLPAELWGLIAYHFIQG